MLQWLLGRELIGEGAWVQCLGSCLLGSQSSVTGGGTSCSWKFSFCKMLLNAELGEPLKGLQPSPPQFWESSVRSASCGVETHEVLVGGCDAWHTCLRAHTSGRGANELAVDRVPDGKSAHLGGLDSVLILETPLPLPRNP